LVMRLPCRGLPAPALNCFSLCVSVFEKAPDRGSRSNPFLPTLGEPPPNVGVPVVCFMVFSLVCKPVLYEVIHYTSLSTQGSRLILSRARARSRALSGSEKFSSQSDEPDCGDEEKARREVKKRCAELLWQLASIPRRETESAAPVYARGEPRALPNTTRCRSRLQHPRMFHYCEVELSCAIPSKVAGDPRGRRMDATDKGGRQSTRAPFLRGGSNVPPRPAPPHAAGAAPVISPRQSRASSPQL